MTDYTVWATRYCLLFVMVLHTDARYTYRVGHAIQEINTITAKVVYMGLINLKNKRYNKHFLSQRSKLFASFHVFFFNADFLSFLNPAGMGHRPYCRIGYGISEGLGPVL